LLVWLHMVRIKYTARPISDKVLLETSSMASEDVAEGEFRGRGRVAESR
jgi:hypothetical protein